MIIEYLGISGCGKNFQKDLLRKRLEEEGKQYLDISRYRGMPLWLKFFYKIADYAIYCLPHYLKLVNQYKKTCEGCLDNPKYFPLPMKTCIRDIVLASFLHDVFGNSHKIILNDEGQLLRIAILIVQYDVDIQKIMHVYNTEKHLEDIRYIQIPVEEAIENIRKRNRHVCEMDEMKDDELMEYLNNLDQVCRDCLRYIK